MFIVSLHSLSGEAVKAHRLGLLSILGRLLGFPAKFSLAPLRTTIGRAPNGLCTPTTPATVRNSAKIPYSIYNRRPITGKCRSTQSAKCSLNQFFLKRMTEALLSTSRVPKRRKTVCPSRSGAACDLTTLALTSFSTMSPIRTSRRLMTVPS